MQRRRASAATASVRRRCLPPSSPRPTARSPATLPTPRPTTTYTTPYNVWAGRRLLHVDDLFVPEAFRPRGIGPLLMARIGEVAAGTGSQVRWMVKPDNRRAIEFYESLG